MNLLYGVKILLLNIEQNTATLSKILSKIGRNKKELLERKIGENKSKIASSLITFLIHTITCIIQTWVIIYISFAYVIYRIKGLRKNIQKEKQKGQLQK